MYIWSKKLNLLFKICKLKSTNTKMSILNEAFVNAIGCRFYKSENPLFDIQKEKLLSDMVQAINTNLFDMAGKSYEDIHKFIIDHLLKYPLYLFGLGEIYEIPTRELCIYIIKCLKQAEADTIYIYFCRSGILELALKKVLKEEFSDLKITIKSFDKKPISNYCEVYEKNENELIDEDDKDKRILSVYSFPPLSKFRNIIKGIRTNKQNFSGILFLGDIVRGMCLPRNSNPLLSLINMKLISFGSEPTISFNQIYDPNINEKVNNILKLPFQYYSSQQLLYVNKDMRFNEKPKLNIVSWCNLKSITNLDLNQIIMFMMLEHIYLMLNYGILWDLNLDAIPRLLDIVSSKLYYPEASFKGCIGGKQLNEEVYDLYFKTIDSCGVRHHIHRIKYIKEGKAPIFNKYIDILPLMNMRINLLYRQRILCEICCIDNFYDEFRLKYCAVCCKLSKIRCKACKIMTYCSKKCKEIDYKLLNHKEECHIFNIIDTKQENLVKSENDGKLLEK